MSLGIELKGSDIALTRLNIVGDQHANRSSNISMDWTICQKRGWSTEDSDEAQDELIIRTVSTLRNMFNLKMLISVVSK